MYQCQIAKTVFNGNGIIVCFVATQNNIIFRLLCCC